MLPSYVLFATDHGIVFLFPQSAFFFLRSRAKGHWFFGIVIRLTIGTRIAIAIVAIEQKAIEIAITIAAFAIEVKPLLFCVSRHDFFSSLCSRSVASNSASASQIKSSSVR